VENWAAGRPRRSPAGRRRVDQGIVETSRVELVEVGDSVVAARPPLRRRAWPSWPAARGRPRRSSGSDATSRSRGARTGARARPAAHHEAVAVVLDLVHPCTADRHGVGVDTGYRTGLASGTTCSSGLRRPMQCRASFSPSFCQLADKDAAEALRSSVVAKAQRSPSAVAKQPHGTTPDGLPVHSFQSLLNDLATLAQHRRHRTQHKPHLRASHPANQNPGEGLPPPRRRQPRLYPVNRALSAKKT
jgi:hypothetical protein